MLGLPLSDLSNIDKAGFWTGMTVLYVLPTSSNAKPKIEYNVLPQNSFAVCCTAKELYVAEIVVLLQTVPGLRPYRTQKLQSW